MARSTLMSITTRALGFAFGLGILVSAQPAHATGKLAVDVEAAIPSDNVPNADTGWGGAVRFGNEWNLVLLKLTPEIQGNYHKFGGDSDASQFGVMAGGRLGIGLALQPSVYAHAGVGHYSYHTLLHDVSQTSLAYDVGLALDITALPLVDFGAHASLNGVAGDNDADALTWYSIGGHVAISLPY